MILNSPTISGSLTVTGNIISSGSITLSGSVASASYAASASFVALAQSASNAVSAQTASFANAFTVASTLTAQTLVVQTITSSVEYITGSSINGSLNSNTHLFTGSVSVTGSSTFTAGVTPLTVKGTNAGTMYTEYYYNTSTLVGSIGNGSGLLSGANASDFIIRSEADYVVATGGNNRRMTITSAGNVGIGVSAPRNIFEIQKVTNNTSTGSASNASLLLSQGGNINELSQILFGYTLNTSPAVVGYITTDASAYTKGALIFATRDVTTDSVPTERMRITSGGDVLMGTGNVGNLLIRQTVAGTVDNNSQSIGNNGINYMNRVSGTGLYHIFFNNGNNIVGSITSNTTNTQFNTSSDYRLKKDLKDFNALNILLNMKLYDFAWKLNDSRMYGVIAHELKEILPYAVVGEKDELDENGNIRPQGVDYSLLTPVLVKAIQELKTQNDALQSRIETLESK